MISYYYINCDIRDVIYTKENISSQTPQTSLLKVVTFKGNRPKETYILSGPVY